ncbi:UPF0158 family protein [Massilia sp. 9I]|uniref:UPF0158 family protein n=1 Tax=Massilia sp. 9I TaxID=2653152 RepID=UPI0012F2E18A|nr:UPF0158 family protein [Massilia sp. 9I]VXC62237.1 conserved hypothetical protein [Massilia sp. 9I]
MATVNADDLENAMLLVSGQGGLAEAWVSLETGSVYVRSDDIPEEAGPLPEDIDDPARYASVPDSNSLDLGQALVFAFTEAEMPDEYERVRQMFRRPGAYRNFSRLVDDRDLRDRWHDYRNERTAAALRDWCEENGLQLAG